VASLQAGRTGIVNTVGGDALVITAGAGDTLNVTANDGSARLRNTAMGTSARSVDVRATGASGDAVLGADPTATAGASERLTGPTGLTVRVQGDRDATVNLQNSFDVASLTAGRAGVAISTQGDARVTDARAGTTLSVRAAQGQVTLGTATTTGAAGAQGSDITAVGRGVTITSANAAGSLDVRATAGDATVELVNAGGNARVDASRDAHVRNATMTATVADDRELRVNGGRNAALGRAPGGALAGSLGQSAADRTAVIVSAGTGNATVDLPGDAARLTQVTSDSGDVSIRAPGAITVRGSGGVAAKVSGRDVNLTSSGGGVTVANATASRALTVDAAGTATVNAVSGDTVLVRAADLTVDGAVKGRVTTVESRNGALNLGDGTGSTSGMTIDRAEFARLEATEELKLYAGATNGTARGDIAVGDLTLDGAKVKTASLKAGPDATVRVSGKVQAATDGSGALVIGESAAAGGWTPKAIHVTGSIGEATTTAGLTFTNVKALGSVELNAIGDVLIGTQQFITAIQNAPAGGINVARQMPAGIRAQGADVNRVFVASGTMTLRADGRVVQQSTSQFAERPVGVFLSNPGKSATAITFGRTGGPSASGSLTPGLIDLSMSMNDRGGTLLFGQIVAASPSVSLGGLTPNNLYRINGCTIGGAGTCTVLSEKLVDVPIENLVIENLLEAQDAPLLSDPTITGAGNEEIWRGGELAEEEEEEE
jgi:hypothetical protein